MSEYEIVRKKEILNSLITQLLSNFDVIDDEIGKINWSEFDANFLRFCIREEIITPFQAKSLITARLRKIAEKCHKEHTNEKVEPDHVSSPETFAYGIRNCVFSMEEIEKINFRDESLGDFIKISPKNFHEIIFEKLLTFK